MHLLHWFWADEMCCYTLVQPEGRGELQGRDHFPEMVRRRVDEYFAPGGISEENVGFLCELARLGWYGF